MRNNIFRNGRVHVMERMCDTCIFRPDNTIKRVPQMVAEATKNQSTIICHNTLYKKNKAACYGFFKLHATQPLQVAERLDRITFVSATKGD